jgi:hypothetical protein
VQYYTQQLWSTTSCTPLTMVQLGWLPPSAALASTTHADGHSGALTMQCVRSVETF